MKKIWILLLFFPFCSCNDWLNVESEGDVTYANYFKNEQEVASVVTTMFVNERSAFAGNSLFPIEYAGLFCDELYRSGYKTLDVDVFFPKMASASSIKWSPFYNLIYLANTLEENRWRFEGITEDRADFWIAQANFMKALAFFRIAQMWGDAPLPKSSESLDPLGKSPAKDLLEEAIRCAELALILPAYDKMTDENGKAITSRQYASLGTVNTLLANIYAWMGGQYGDAEYWEKAEEYASVVIDQKAGVYSLEPDIASLVTNVFGTVRKSNEIIFSITRSQVDDDYWNLRTYGRFYPGFVLLGYPITTGDPQEVEVGFVENGDVDARVRVETVKALYSASDDRRKEYWKDLGDVEYINGKVSPYAYLYKWRDATISDNEDANKQVIAIECNKVIWRLADLILLRGECRARLNRIQGEQGALADLNTIRNRAGLGDYAGDKDAVSVRREIFNERERELLGEGHRYFDVVRNAFFIRDNFYLNKLSSTYGKLTSADIENGALYMPVSDDAFNKNPYMKQNTYWLWKK